MLLVHRPHRRRRNSSGVWPHIYSWSPFQFWGVLGVSFMVKSLIHSRWLASISFQASVKWNLGGDRVCMFSYRNHAIYTH
jgi:hypothetical protein